MSVAPKISSANVRLLIIFEIQVSLSNAFDKVNHYKLFASLLNAGLPKWFVSVLINWTFFRGKVEIRHF